MTTMNEPLLSAQQPTAFSAPLHRPDSVFTSSVAPSLRDDASIRTTESRDTIRAQPARDAAPRACDIEPNVNQNRAGMAGKYGLYKSEDDYLTALRAWAEEQKYTRLGEQGLIGFYGRKTMDEYAADQPPHFIFGRKRRATTAVDGQGVTHGAGSGESQVDNEVHGAGRRKSHLVTGWMKKHKDDNNETRP